MTISETPIPGCFEIHPDVIKDERGVFVKTFNKAIFEQYNLAADFAEEYYSCSKKGVLRGFHFQMPPHEHIKIVSCVYGMVMDAIVDLRKGSPSYGKHVVFELGGEGAKALYLAKGVAHAFYAMSDLAIVMYKVTTAYAPAHDAGILWNSAGVEWPGDTPILSKRDRAFQPFSTGGKDG